MNLTMTVAAKNGMVASIHPLASQAATKVLRNGGNAIDASVTTSAVMGVVAPQYSGLGGGGLYSDSTFRDRRNRDD